jgi:hypothetical protein
MEWQHAQQQAMQAPQVCHALGVLLTREGFRLSDVSCLVPAIEDALRTRKEAVVGRATAEAEARRLREALQSVVAWVEEAIGMQDDVELHLGQLAAKLKGLVGLRTRISGMPTVLDGLRLPGKVAAVVKEAAARARAAKAAAVAAAAAASPPAKARPDQSAGAGMSSAEPPPPPVASVPPASIANPSVGGSPGSVTMGPRIPVAEAIALMGGGIEATSAAREAVQLGVVEVPKPFSAFKVPQTPAASVASPLAGGPSPAGMPGATPAGQPAAAGSPPGLVKSAAVAAGQPVPKWGGGGGTKDSAISYQHKEPGYDWRRIVVWSEAVVDFWTADEWMKAAGHKWRDVWWEEHQLDHLLHVFSKLAPARGFGSKVYDVIRDCTAATRFKGWINLSDVVYALRTKNPKATPFDIMAAGVGPAGLPRDFVFCRVTVKDPDDKAWSTVFARCTVSLEGSTSTSSAGAGAEEAAVASAEGWGSGWAGKASKPW